MAAGVWVGCHTITEDLPPAQTVSGPNPILVSPPPGNSVLIIATPAPSQPPPPTHSNPSPSPSSPSQPPPQQNQNKDTQVSAMVTSFLRDGSLQLGARGSYKPGDVLYLTCTPKDSDGKPTKNHGGIQGWTIGSNNLGGGDFFYTDTDSFNPDVHVSPSAGSGSIEATCRVDDIGSNTLSMAIQP
jgi:hypothetical protein